MMQALARFCTMFKEKMAAEKAKRWDDFEHTWSQASLSVGLYSNLNAYATIFKFKMFVTVTPGDQIKVSSEMRLSALQSDIAAFM